jgi:DNA-binding transcriptional MerR regulator
MTQLKIGMLTRRTGTSASTIRYYEEIGLLPRALRQAGGQRSYGEEDIARLSFIRRSRDLGLSIEHVRSLLRLATDPKRSCLDAPDLARHQMAIVRTKLRELKRFERNLMASSPTASRRAPEAVGLTASFCKACPAMSGGPARIRTLNPLLRRHIQGVSDPNKTERLAVNFCWRLLLPRP